MFYLTGFKPFQGREKNGSETLMDSLSQESSLDYVHFNTLEVSWEAFDDFYQQLCETTVSGIIGFGEGERESIVVELVGRNICSGVDEFGVKRRNQRINDREPSTNPSRIRIPANRNIIESGNAGDFLCNYELFHLNRIHTPISGFVHLPPQGGTSDEEYLSAIKPTVMDIVSCNFLGEENT
ncbi:MAG: hypothetical protein AAGJ81_10110 [Verrucomicrobiota bacterium]